MKRRDVTKKSDPCKVEITVELCDETDMEGIPGYYAWTILADGGTFDDGYSGSEAEAFEDAMLRLKEHRIVTAAEKVS